MTDTVLIARQNKSGMRRRGYLLKGLRFLANDPKATPQQRLEACKMLFALETAPELHSGQSKRTPNYSNDLRPLLAKCEQGNFA
jgi:hypothetical protein